MNKEDNESESKPGRSTAAGAASEIYVQALLKVHAQYHEIVKEAFDMDTAFVSSLDKVARSSSLVASACLFTFSFLSVI